ncbi:MAG: FtsQ-type POTRA domain-containing protein [Treponemataceae bacterium]
MSDSGLFLDDAVPEKIDSPNRIERALKWSVLALAVVLVVEAVWFLIAVPCMPLRSVEIFGADGLSRSSLYLAAGLKEKTSFFSLDARSVKRGIESLAVVESVSVVRRFPDGVRINVVMRSQVAVALAVTSDARTLPVSIDRNGVVFKVGSGVAGSGASGPIISGLLFENPQPGIKLPLFLHSLVADLARLRAENPALLDALSEIRVVKKGYDAYELVLYPSYRAVRVRIGSQLNEDVLRYMMLLLDVLASKGIETDELDFRTGTAAYRTKEG